MRWLLAVGMASFNANLQPLSGVRIIMEKVVKRRKPPSPAKIRANQENSKHSTGPTSENGKRRSSQNAKTLGLYAESDLLLGESAEERDAFIERIVSSLKPTSVVLEILAHQIAKRMWIIKRKARSKKHFIDREILTDVMDRKFPSAEIAYVIGDRAVRSEKERREILANHRKELVPTENDLETTFHRLLSEKPDLLFKIDTMELREDNTLTRLLSTFVLLTHQEARKRNERDSRFPSLSGSYTHHEPTLEDTDTSPDL